MNKQFKIYRKTQLIEVVGKSNGFYIVRNVDDKDDTWLIQSEVFEKTYEEVDNQKMKGGKKYE